MLTRTKKWLVVFAVAVVALVLTACAVDFDLAAGDETVELTIGETRTIVPEGAEDANLVWQSNNRSVAVVSNGTITAIGAGNAVVTARAAGSDVMVEINVTVVRPEPTEVEVIPLDWDGPNNNSLLVGNRMNLDADVIPFNADSAVVWSSSDESVATVNSRGVVTGLNPGTVTITAAAVADESVRGQFDITVYTDLDTHKVLSDAMAYIRANFPSMVNDDFQLPVYPNPLVKVEYFDDLGDPIPGNTYTYFYERDTNDSVTVYLTYEGTEINFNIGFRVVDDLEVNDFVALDQAREVLNKHFAMQLSYKVYDDVYLPDRLSDLIEDPIRDVEFDWGSTRRSVISSTGVYNRPNDDTVLRLEAYSVVGDVSAMIRLRFVANGYNEQETVEWITENVLPDVTEVRGENLTLPTRCNKFGATITWTSSNPDVMDTRGRMDPFLEDESTVVLTALIEYPGTESDSFAFTAEVELDPILVIPAENDAQRVVLDMSNYFDDNLPSYFPWGLPGREGNTFPVINEVTRGEYEGTDITWEYEDGIFNDEWELQTQFLRYRETALTYTITIGDDTATGEFYVNVGVAEVPNTLYIGGRFVALSTTTSQPFDALDTFAPDDNPDAGSAWGRWDGFTFWRDVDGVRYQWFGQDIYVAYITEGPDGVDIDDDGYMSPATDEDGNVTGGLTTLSGSDHANYQYTMWLNLTDKDVNMPIAFLNYKGDNVINEDPNGRNAQFRQTSQSYDGARFGVAADADGVVTFGYGHTWIETAMLNEAEENEVYDEHGDPYIQSYVVIPAGGFGWSPFSNHNDARIGDVFAVPGAQLGMAHFDSKYSDYR